MLKQLNSDRRAATRRATNKYGSGWGVDIRRTREGRVTDGLPMTIDPRPPTPRDQVGLG
jgi:hypothetical protein